MKEIWKDIDGYENLYQVSNYGNIKSKNNILKPLISKRGYLYINLYKDKKGKHFYIHRLVAQAFIPNPKNYPCINHKNEIKTDNMVNNLEWCTIAYNNKYGTLRERIIKTKTLKYGKKINQYDLNGNFIKTWDSTHEIERKTNILHQNIIKCCKNKSKTAGGYVWKYKTEYNVANAIFG